MRPDEFPHLTSPAPRTRPTTVALPVSTLDDVTRRWLDEVADDLHASGGLYESDTDEEQPLLVAPPSSAWRNPPKRPDEIGVAQARLVVEALEADPGLTVRKACALVAEQHGLNPNTLRKLREAAIAHGILPRAPRRAGAALTFSPSPQSRAAHQRACQRAPDTEDR